MPDEIVQVVVNPVTIQVIEQPARVVEVVAGQVLGGGGGGGGATDLGYTPSTRFLSSSTGMGVTLPLADGTNAGLLSSTSFLAIGTALQPGAIIPAANVSGLAAIATSGSASDLGAGTLPAARFTDTSHGNRAGGALHADATTTVSGFMSGADKTKLNGIATGATANATDAALRDRATHTGGQPASTISDFAEAVDDRVAALVVAGTNMTITYNDVTNTLIFDAAGGGGATNLAYDPATRVVSSDTGTDATLTLVDGTNAGLMTSADKTKLDGVATGATANATDAALRDRATHTGTQLASTISNFAATVIGTVLTGFAAAGTRTAIVATDTILVAFGKVQKYLNDLAAVAFSGSAADLTTGTLPTARLPAFGSGDVSFAASGGAGTIATDAVTNAKLANMPTGNFKARQTAGTGDPEDLTPAQAAALLPAFQPSGAGSAKGLVPDPGTTPGTTRYLREDATWVTPPGGGGGSPGGASGEIQWNNAGAFAGAADVEIEGGQLRFPSITTPAAPAANGVKLFGRSVGGRILPAIIGPSGLDSALQPHIGRNKVARWNAAGSSTIVAIDGFQEATAVGTNTASNWASSLWGQIRKMERLVTVAATNAVVQLRENNAKWTVGGAAANRGGFHAIFVWGPATGVATTTHRAFCGFRNTTVATDVEPSTLTTMCGMGWDAADTNIQFMHNDASGTATKIDLGASFPVPTVDRTNIYRLTMFSPPGTTQSVSYEVENLDTGAIATGTVTTDLPNTTTVLCPSIQMSVGGTSSVIGIAVSQIYIETDN